MNYPLAITGWSILSPLGMGCEAFSRALAEGHGGIADEAGIVPEFDIRAVLGPRRTRSMDRATGLAVAAVGMLLEQTAPARDEALGLVLGTNTGSVKSMTEFTRDSLTQAKPFHVDPARFPNTVMNCAAGQCAIWHRLLGPNATIAGGDVTGLLALQYAARLIRVGHAPALLCGVVEEFSYQRAWLDRLGYMSGSPLGEGCAIFMLESAHAGARVEILAVEFGTANSRHPTAAVLSRCLRAALERGGAAPGDVWAVAPAGYPDERDRDERVAIADVLGDCEVLVPVSTLTGDMSAASAAFQIAALIAHPSPGRLGVVTSIDREGLVGCALLKLA